MSKDIPPDEPGPPSPPTIRRSGSDKRRRRHVHRIRLDDTEYDRLRASAANAAQSISGYIRHRALGDPGPRTRRVPPVDRAALSAAVGALNKVGSNLNQLTRLANIGIALNTAEMRNVLVTLHLALEAVLERLGQ